MLMTAGMKQTHVPVPALTLTDMVSSYSNFIWQPILRLRNRLHYESRHFSYPLIIVDRRKAASYGTHPLS